MFEYTPYVLPFIFSTAILTYLCVYSFGLRKQIETAREFSWLTFTLTIWTVCYALELVSTTLDGKIFWAMMKYLGSAPGPAAWFVFSLYYTNNQKWFTAPKRWVLGIYVLVTIAIVFTNPLHHWYWTEITMVDGYPETQSEHGFYFWVYAVGTYLLILSSVVIYVRHYFRVSSFFRKPAVLMVLGGFLPLAARIPEDFLGLDLIPKLDNIIVFLLVSAIIFFIAISRFNALKILPIAHELIVKNINSGILVLNTTGYVVEINPYAQSLIGSESINAIGKPLEVVLKDWPKLDYSPQLKKQLEQEVLLSHNNTSNFFLVQISPILNKRDISIGHVIVLVDITDRKHAEMELERLARTDVLTEVTNRRHFFELAEIEYERFKRYGHPLTIMLLDVDHFKQVNDNFGHLAGDHVLKHIASECRKALRVTDIFARYGGEEFICLLVEANQEAALETAERIRKNIESSMLEFDGQKIRVTVSIGQIFAQNNTDLKLDNLIDQADKALYVSKSNGRNQVTVWK
ncbi:MAG: diguanylate cyclase [Anaerolineales bacterium]|nr:diguanylate cyclase [Anaerolineales bacterium]